MTGAFIVCSALLMRYSLAVRPKNYLLFAMHTVNVGAQSIQMMRFVLPRMIRQLSLRQGLLTSRYSLQDRVPKTVAEAVVAES